MLRSIFITVSVLLASLSSSAVEIAATLSIASGEYNDEIRPVLFRNNIEMASGTPVEVNLTAGTPEEVVFDTEFDAILRDGNYHLCFVGSDGQLIGKSAEVTVADDDTPELRYDAAIDEVSADKALDFTVGNGLVEINADSEIAAVGIYTIGGAQALAQNVDSYNCSLNTSSLSAGMYVAQITMADGSSVVKKFLNR